MSTPSPGSRSKASMVGRSISDARCRKVCSSSRRDGCPDQGCQIVDDAIINAPALALYRRSPNPVRPIPRTLFFVKVRAVDSVGVTLEADRPVLQMPQVVFRQY